MAIQIFEMFGSVALQGADKAEKDLKDLDTQGKKTSKGLGASFKSVAKGAAVGIAAIGAVGAGLLKVSSNAANTADRVDKLSQKIGISRESFQELDFITSQTGGSIETLQMGVKTLSRAASEAAQGVTTYSDTFDQLGVSVTNADGSLKGQEQLLNETIIALQGMENETQRSAIASELLGRSATELTPLLNAGAGEMERMRTQAHDLGLVMSDTAIDSGVLFVDTMDQLKRSLSTAASSFLLDLMPTLQLFLEWVIANIPAIKQFFSNAFEAISTVLTPVVKAVKDNLLPAFGDLFAVFSGDGESSTEGMAVAMEALGKVLEVVVDTLALAVEWVTELVKMFKTAIDLTVQLSEKLGLPEIAAITKDIQTAQFEQLAAAAGFTGGTGGTTVANTTNVTINNNNNPDPIQVAQQIEQTNLAFGVTR